MLQGVTNRVHSQSPQKINYQAVARDAAGNPLAGQAVQVTFRIRENSPSGAVKYRGAQLYTTNPLGIFTATIGQTTNDSGLFSGIAWGSKNYFLQVLISNNDMGTTQLLSVPYALHANTADSITSIPASLNIWKRSAGNVYLMNGADNLGIGTTTPVSALEINGTFGTTIKTVTASTTLDNTAVVWYAKPTATMTLILPNPSTAKNRRYIIVNRSALTININPSYVSLAGAANTTLLASNSIEIISDGIGWLQIK